MYYFADCSNMNHQQMNERCPGNKFLGLAKLEGYKLVFDGFFKKRDGAVANITELAGSIVWGGLFEISEANLAALDCYEGYPSAYNRKKISVFLEGSEVVDVVVYYRTGQKLGSPSREYKELILQGARNCGLPDDYIKAIRDLRIMLI